jgi:hypothetical protein
MAISTITKIENATVYFPPVTLPSNGQNTTPLTMGQCLVKDDHEKKIDVLNILRMPSDFKPGRYHIEVEARPKSGKAGISYWYVGAQPIQGNG